MTSVILQLFSYIPPGCTSLAQPLDVVCNSPFKKVVDNLATAHMEGHISVITYMGNFTASDCRILTEWIGKAMGGTICKPG